MSWKTKRLFAFLLAFDFFCANAQEIPLSTAENFAQSVFSAFNPEKSNSILTSQTIAVDDRAAMHVIRFSDSGFVITSADLSIFPLLAYSNESDYNVDDLPSACAQWIDNYLLQIAFIYNLSPDAGMNKYLWNPQYFIQQAIVKSEVAPLCLTSWDQGCYYNSMCPATSSSACNHALTGCVATAMAQIMKYWAYPDSGQSNHTYTDPVFGSQSADFGNTAYNWSAMPNQVTSNNSDLAQMLFHVGVSVDMNYSASASFAYNSAVTPALKNYFLYSESAEFKSKNDFTNENWIWMLKNELDNGRPVFYSGTNGSGGHAFVCDGYNSAGLFHFNWGWSGNANGYFAIGNLNPNMQNFNQDNVAIVRIQPASNAPIAFFYTTTTSIHVGDSVQFIDASTNSPTSWSWIFEGATPSTSSEQNPQNIRFDSAGIYQVVLTASNASGADTKIRTNYIQVSENTSSTDDFDANDSFLVFPNPAQDVIFFENFHYTESTGTIRIFDSKGQLITQIDWNQSICHDLSVSSFPSGLYFLEFIPANPAIKSVSTQFLKQ